MKRLFLFLRNLNRDAALDSARNVMAAIGAGTILADMNTLRVSYLFLAASVLSLIWFIDYVRHF